MENGKMKMPIELLLKAFRELDELAARFKSAVSMPAPLRRILEANRKQPEILAGIEAVYRKHQEMIDSFSRFQSSLALLGKRH